MNILITGASSGIGWALAEKYASEDCNLFLAARRTGLIEEKIKALKNVNAEVKIIENDVSRKESVNKAFNECGNIDLAILNAGYGETLTPETFNSEAAEKTLGANIYGMIYWIEKILPGMIENGKGTIAGISSLADSKGFSGSGLYCASKAAASVFLQGLRLDLKSYGIKVITVKPGFVKTPMTDQNDFKMPFLMESEKAAKIIKKGIEKGKVTIKFPMPTSILIGLVNLMPDKIFEFLLSRPAKNQ